MNLQDDHEYQSAVLAALLHDVGKLWQRTGAELDGEYRRVAEACCPSAFSRPSHVHAAWGGRLARDAGLGDLVENLILWHHSAREAPAGYRRPAMVVALADWLASGERHDREEPGSGRPGEETLVSVFSTLRDSRDVTRFPLRALTATGQEHEPGPSVTTDAGQYEQIWRSFQDELPRIPSSPFCDRVERMLSLLEKYTLFVPAAAYRQTPDVSLFHHLKSTAAVAACLFGAGLDEAAIDLGFRAVPAGDDGGPAVAHLVGGDISGIQDFLYTLMARGALKGLRGRSLYLQLLPEAVCARVLARFELPRSNVLYCGGGHFYVLVPAVRDAALILRELEGEIEGTLLDVHRGRLGLALAEQTLTWTSFSGVGFGQAWDRLHARLARNKRRRFHTRLAAADDIRAVMGPHGVGGKECACPVCGEEIDVDGADDSDPEQCDLCRGFEELGGGLARARFMARDQGASPADLPALQRLGFACEFQSEAKHSESAYVLNETDFLRAGQAFLGFRFLARHAPAGRDGAATLEELAERSAGSSRWGVLRMDVDRLGEAFTSGLGDHRPISRLTMLSHLLSYFFSARVEALAREPEFEAKVQLVYSGGDDLFALGAWSILPDFAQRIQEEFRRFTSGRLTLSGGIAIAPGEKYPVYQAAELAGAAMAVSKSAGRDRLTFLSCSQTWPELAEVQSIEQQLRGLLAQGAARSLVTTLKKSWQDRQDAAAGTIGMFPLWRLFYAFKRLKERTPRLAKEIDDLEKSVVKENDLHPQLDLAVRWAELETRRTDA